MPKNKSTLDSIFHFLHVSGMDSPNRLAAGICLGIWIGLLPKLSLLPWILAGVTLLSTANLLTLLIGFGLGCLLIPLSDLAAIPLGERLLDWEFLTPLIASTLETPGLVHLRLNETACLGNFVLGALACLPLFILARSFFSYLQPHLEDWFGSQPASSWLVANSPAKRPPTGI